MHELSIALSLIDLASERLARIAPPRRVAALHLRIGPLAGVVEEALRFAFDAAAPGSPVEGARLVVEDVPLTLYCAVCDRDVEAAGPSSMVCPVCDTPTPVIVTGRELELRALEVEDDGDEDRGGPGGDSQEERPAGG